MVGLHWALISIQVLKSCTKNNGFCANVKGPQSFESCVSYTFFMFLGRYSWRHLQLQCCPLPPPQQDAQCSSLHFRCPIIRLCLLALLVTFNFLLSSNLSFSPSFPLQYSSRQKRSLHHVIIRGLSQPLTLFPLKQARTSSWINEFKSLLDAKTGLSDSVFCHTTLQHFVLQHCSCTHPHF